MAFGLSGSLSACFMYIFALLCVDWVANKDACLLATAYIQKRLICHFFHGNKGRQMLLFETPKCNSSINLFIP